MDTFRTDKKIEKLKRNIDVSLEREVRQKEKLERRTIRSEERREMRKKWVQGAYRVEKKLPEVWNPKTDVDKGTAKGYFGGVSFDNEGRIIR